MTPATTLAIGFTEDVLSGGLPGVWTLSFVLPLMRWWRGVIATASAVACPASCGGGGLLRGRNFCLRRGLHNRGGAGLPDARRAFPADRFQCQRTRHDRAVLRPHRLGDELAAP